MNRVVVGFDFSSGSAYAVDLAIDIANRLKSDIRLVYVKEKNENEEPIREEIERRNAAVEPLLQGIKLEYVLREGNPADELTAQAAEDHAVLLIVGTHGMSGLKTNMLGRNSYHTIEKSPVPVLIVREDFNFNKSLDTIVVPIDSSDDTRQKVGAAAMFAKALIAIMTEQEKSFSSLILGNYAQQMINQSSIPVLTVRPKAVVTDMRNEN